MGTFPCVVTLFVVSEHVGGHRQPLEVLRLRRRPTIRRRQVGKSLREGFARRGGPSGGPRPG